MTADRHAELEQVFQPHILVDVGGELPDVNPVAAQAACEELSLWLLESFEPRWETVTPNPGGTAGHHAAYLQAKTEWLRRYLHTDRRDSPEAHACLDRLQAFWREWAGYQLTAGPA
ncbi:hypothetical protein [Deinococcus enclensis]|uniref:Transposase n=1 Tax=Deinococcus enclensis TaxID=1049582 RepID=A0ABT9MB47_9DEIO|nr:hypothetical protein [Deinococcus enclensis]MDP9763815.1 hypothetical protein [Deinococcus enclensis]